MADAGNASAIAQLTELEKEITKIKSEDIFYWNAFWTLSRDRQVGMGEGFIPFTAIDCYARRYDVTGLDFDDLCSVITAMDSVYLEEKEKKRPKAKN